MSDVPAPLTLGAALDAAVAALAASSPSARIDAEVLVCHAAGVSRAQLLAHPEQPLSESARVALAALVERRCRGEPVAYLTGRREFWSLDLAVSPATLIPRPETELLVERALARIPAGVRCAVADLGTGSGAVALAIAVERPQTLVIATDCSLEALAIAQANATRLGIAGIEFRHGDWFAPLRGRRFHVLVSNPPYVAEDDPHLERSDVRFEPRAALAAGPEGLDALRGIAASGTEHLEPDGWLLLEHGFAQGAAVRALLEAHGYRDIRTYTDLDGRERVTEGRRA